MRLLLVVFVFCAHANYPQKVKEYSVKAGEIPALVLPKEAMYVLPSFTVGTGSFKDGTLSTQQFNYDFLLDEMHLSARKVIRLL